MLSYRHSFHAGNHADVIKHTVLSLIIEALKEKEKPFFYLDTHAGAGCYQLSAEHAEQTGEFTEGIARLWQRNDLPPLLQPYLSAVKKLNPATGLRYYPGSPLIASHLLRDNDKLQFSELHPSDYSLLRNAFSKDPRIRTEKADGFQQIKSKLPPLSRRGLILIDPSYEVKSDYQRVVNVLLDGYKRFATGVFALWYPVVIRQHIRRLCRQLQETGIRHILQIELAVRPDSDQRGMTASGMLVINPPWKLEQQMQALLPWLHQTLVPSECGHTFTRWLVPE